MPVYRITDISKTFNARGSYINIPVVVVAFYGCNNKCEFCNSKGSSGQYEIPSVRLSDEEIVNKIKQYEEEIVILTGGEPSLYDLRSLISEIQNLGKSVLVETNGNSINNIDNADHIQYSPKPHDTKNDKVGIVMEVKYFARVHEVLVPIRYTKDLRGETFVNHVVKLYPILREFNKIWIQPIVENNESLVFGSRTEKNVEFAKRLAFKYRVRLSS